MRLRRNAGGPPEYNSAPGDCAGTPPRHYGRTQVHDLLNTAETVV